MITDQNGNAVWQWDNTAPYGDNLPNQNPNGTSNAFVFNLRFPGQYYDIETGTYYNFYRDYDSSVGRYVESDPIGLRGGQFATYSYVGANPLSRIDTSGLKDSAMTPIPTDPNAAALTKLVRQISGCLCKLNPRFCIDPNHISAGDPPFIGTLIGKNPSGATSAFGYSTINVVIFGNTPNLTFSSAPGMDGPSIMDLAETVAHESLHETQESWWRRMGLENPAIDDEANAFIDAHSNEIKDCLRNQCGRK